MNSITTIFFIFAALLVTASSSFSARPDPVHTDSSRDEEKPPIKKVGGDGEEGGFGGFFGPGGGFNIPGFGSGIGGGYGAGYGGPSGGYSKGGIIRPTVVCKEKGPCYKKKLTCPAKCFGSFSRSGKGYGAGGGGGGCTIDCKKKCVAYC